MQKQILESGFSEALASVTDATAQARVLCAVGGWEILWQGTSDPAALATWGCSEASCSEILLHNPGDSSGYLRLLQFGNCKQEFIRPNPQTWDTGGIIDLNVRVLDLADKYRHLQAAGWYGISDPIHWTFGTSEVCEWIGIGPDGLAIAIIERLAPPLDGWPTLKRFSRVFNSSQVVSDMEQSMAFYRDGLGFSTVVRQKTPMRENPGENVLGIPHNLAHRIEVEIAILHPGGEMDGSVELVQFHGLEGRDFSARAAPPNLGVLGLRFPARDIVELGKRLEEIGVKAAGDIREMSIAPHGRVKLLAVQAPEGAWLEFYEPTP